MFLEQSSTVMELHTMFRIHEKGAQQEILRQDSNPNHKHRERVFRPRISLFGLNEEEVRSRYRFSTEVILELYEQIQQDIEPNCERNHAVPGMVKLLSALHYFSSASFQGTVSALSGISQPSFSRHLTQVLKAINKLTPQYIVFPSDKAAIQTIKDGFFKMSSFPNVMGVIDCTHVALSPPTEDIYRNSKNFHSLNVQMVCASDMRILNLVAGYPGSTHDSYILKHSSLHTILTSGNLPEGWILGDDAYPVTEWLLTPIKYPKTKAEKSYNAAHKTAHSVIERTFGSLKSRFRCLDRSGGVLQYSPEKGAQIILACCILHNLAVSRNQHVDILDDLEAPPPVPPVSREENTEAGKQARIKVINQYFTFRDDLGSYVTCWCPLCFIKSKVSTALYQKILEHFVLPCAYQLYGDTDFLFQNLAPAHTAKITNTWFNDHDITVLDWPANSPDLNPIENLWSFVERKMS